MSLLAGRRTPPAPSQAAEAARRHGGVVHGIAWGAAALLPGFVVGPSGVVALRVTGGGDAYASVVTAAYAGLPGLTFLGVHALGERTWPRPTGPVRRAALVPRDLTVPAWLLRVTVGWTVALAVTLVVCGLTADDGRGLTLGTSSASPYPGWRYGVPVALAVTGVAFATWAALRMIVRRPAVLDADPAYDAASRLLAAHRVLRGVQLFLPQPWPRCSLRGGRGGGGRADGLGLALAVTAAAVALASVAVAVVPAAAPATATRQSWSPPMAPAGPSPAGSPDGDGGVDEAMSVSVEVDLASGVPPYEQIRLQVLAHVAAGRLKAGDRMPTIRDLATDLGVAPGTVQRAYRELEQAGVVATRRRTGTVVTDGPPRARPAGAGLRRAVRGDGARRRACPTRRCWTWSAERSSSRRRPTALTARLDGAGAGVRQRLTPTSTGSGSSSTPNASRTPSRT